MKSDRTKSEETAGKQSNLEHALDSEDAGVDPNLRLIRLFNHYRHDWMNEIQLLFGYVKLKKYDKLEDLMEKIKNKVQQESFISKLGNTELIVYLLSFQAEVKDLLLEIEMEREVHLNELPLDSQGLCRLLMGLIQVFKSSSVFKDDGLHSLVVKLIEKSDLLLIEMRYQGLIGAGILAAELEKVMFESIQTVKWDIQLLDERHAAMYIEVPFCT
ncbi:Spo0B domain-containing protein [Paenibacillus radicis (ex Xue et al. 2023)]|uniref:Spo0B domain-containing protein n=1 Tax=Paenibacillus radicis (ex Xue et al. 2023) TaxID=2972489 RepID=A0ABT1Y8Q0_9BACL|nr:Spo0B domain-containing protein [Paenibacillus radicis (ex Xue et al. 2023)]MCR8629582.1 Spo0B domain-containing protein [Paenibacillus radicis (ex Xue et al. 2023)]